MDCVVEEGLLGSANIANKDFPLKYCTKENMVRAVISRAMIQVAETIQAGWSF